MVINDLKQICPRCDGTGFQPGFAALGVNQINYDTRCPVCSGRGFRLTELGQDLVNMLRPFMEELIREQKPEVPGKSKPSPGPDKPS